MSHLEDIRARIGFGFYSGALDAWAVDLLPSGAEPTALKRIFVHGQLWKNFFYAIGGVLGVALFAKRDNPFIPGTFLSAAILCGILTLHAARYMRQDETTHINGRHTVNQPPAMLRQLARQVLLGARIMCRDFRISGLVAAAAVAFLYLQVLVLYWPWFLAHSGTSSVEGAKGAAVPIAASWLLVYAARACGNGLAAFPLALATARPTLGIASAVGLSAIPMLFLGFGWKNLSNRMSGPLLIGLAVAAYSIVRLGEGMGDPLRQIALNRVLPPPERATILSVSSTFSMLVSTIGLLVAGVLVEHAISVPALWAILAVIIVATLPVYFLILNPRHP